MNSKTAFITGVTDQDGTYISRLLLEKGSIVDGVERRASSFNTGPPRGLARERVRASVDVMRIATIGKGS